MKHSGLLLLISALPLAAQTPSLNCDENRFRNNDQFTHCEMREQTLASPGRLLVDGQTNGGITVKGWDRGDVLVRAQVQAQAPSDGEARALAAQVIVHASGSSIAADGPSGLSGRHWSVTYEIFTPRRTDLNLSAHNGGISISGVAGTIEFKTQNGGVHLAKVAGDVRGRTQNGGVHVELDGARWEGNGLDVQSQNGGVNIVLPSNYSAHLETSTVNGAVRSEHPEVVLSERRQTSLSANIGGGGATLKVVTTNGGVHIARQGPAAI